MARIKIEISISKPTLGKEYDSTEQFETSYEGDQQSYLYIVSQVIPLIPVVVKEVR